MEPETKSIDSKLKAAYERFKDASARGIPDRKIWDATRIFMKAIVEWHGRNDYSKFQSRLKKLLGLKSASQVDEYLAAARFATARVPASSKRGIRIVDLKSNVRCPNVSQMAMGNSLLTSKQTIKRTAGRDYLASAIRGDALPASRKMKWSVNRRRFEYSLSNIQGAAEGAALTGIAALLNSLAALGDQSARDCLQGLCKAVADGGPIEIHLAGLYKASVDANRVLAEQMAAPVQSQPILDPPVPEGIRPPTPVVRGARYDYDRGEKRMRLERLARIRERAELLATLTGNSAGKVCTSKGNANDLLLSIKTGWEGPTEFWYADVIAENDVDAQEQLAVALHVLRDELRGRRVGLLVFPREPIGYHEERLLADKAGETADMWMAIDVSSLVNELHASHSNLPRKTIEVCVQDTLKQLRQKLKCEPSKAEVLHEAQMVLMTLTPARNAFDLQIAVEKLLELFPRLAETTAALRVANAVARLRDKYGFEPSVEAIVCDADRAMQGRGKVSSRVLKRLKM